ncbi:hypothetical protein MtrunA17_Chr2g0300071 [Medicago truncatula]|uniref:Uncharacterized protein n=1 Tax=Medicago truncatula TaxID=3880 RepID=A0A396JAV4_MEDTR|nr:hypothetical protein MtrunA17_Chr2g0300071 [Medicago truncatula]
MLHAIQVLRIILEVVFRQLGRILYILGRRALKIVKIPSKVIPVKIATSFNVKINTI